MLLWIGIIMAIIGMFLIVIPVCVDKWEEFVDIGFFIFFLGGLLAITQLINEKFIIYLF